MQKVKLYSLFNLLLISFSVVAILYRPISAIAKTTDPTKDLQRRRLHTFLTCLSEEAIDWGDDIDEDDAIKDILTKDWDNEERVVVGFDRDSGNGVMTCKTVIRQGAIALAPTGLPSDPSEDELENWFIKRLTGTNYAENGGKSISKDSIKDNRKKLYDEVQAAKDAIDPPNDALLQSRFLPLVDVCYTYEKNSSKPRGDNDFEVSGTGFFYMKPSDDIKSEFRSWDGVDINDGYGDSTKVKLGDIELGWRWGINNSFDAQFEKTKSDFYPIGSDIGQTSGYAKNAIVECEFVEANKDIIFAGITIGSNGNLLLNGQPLNNTAAPGNNASGTSPDNDSCESSSGGFGWLLCAGINLLATAIDRYENIIRNQLEVVTPGSEIEEAWSRVRTIALILLVPIMLVMVISTALGFEFIDAYTVKRALPRLAIAVILITLSFGLTKFAIDVFNTLGTGIQGIMLQPFGGEKSLNEIVSTGAGVTFNATTGLVATGAFFAGIGTGVLFPLILSAAIGIFLGFVVLIIRQVLLFFLIIVAPVAIVAWVLPGTEKFWKLWWGNFSKLLFMFPLIMALLAAGNIAATIIPEQQGSTNALTFILILIAFVAPFFFIPATFKAGGAFFGALAGATMGALANQRKGLRDRANASRQEGWQRFKTGTGRGRLRNSNLVRRAGMGVGVGARGRFGFGATGRAARSQLGQVVSDENLKNNARLQKLAFDDDGNAVMALSGGTRAGAEQAADELLQGWRTTLRASDRYIGATAQEQQDMEAALVVQRNQALAAASAVGFTRANAQSALSTLAQNKSRSVAAGAAGRTTIQNGINRLHGNNRVAADEQRQNFAYTSNQAGRADLGGSNWNSRSQGGVSDSSLLGLERSSVAQGASGHENGIIAARADAEAMWATGNEEDMDRVATHLLELDAMLPYTTGPTRQEVLESRQRLAGVREYAEARVAAGAIAPRRYERAPGDGGDPPLTPPAGGGGGAGGP